MITKISDREYFDRPEINQSMIKDVLKMTPRDFSHHQYADRDVTPNMMFGTLVHCMLLEPEEFKNRYAIFNFDYDLLGGKLYKNLKNTKVWKDSYSAFCAVNEGKTIIDDLALEEAHHAVNMVKCSTKLFDTQDDESQSEVAVINTLNGVSCKAKLDLLLPKNKMIIDIKTTVDSLTDSSLTRHIYKWDFPIQAAFYLDLMKQETGEDYIFAFVLVNSTAPYDCRVMLVSDKMTPDFLNVGREKIEDGLILLHQYNSEKEKFFEKRAFIPDHVPAWY